MSILIHHNGQINKDEILSGKYASDVNASETDTSVNDTTTNNSLSSNQNHEFYTRHLKRKSGNFSNISGND